MAEIDGKAIEASKTYFPKIAGALDNPRVKIDLTDGIKHVDENTGEGK